jgi:hypothetical protein
VSQLRQVGVVYNLFLQDHNDTLMQRIYSFPPPQIVDSSDPAQCTHNH